MRKTMEELVQMKRAASEGGPMAHASFTTVTKANAASRSVDVIASTDDVDASGEVLTQDWDLRRYKANPVVLYNHNMGSMFAGEAEDTLPIGFASNVAVESGKLKATLNFVDAKASELAERCYQGFAQGSLRAVSVGFRATKATSVTRGDRQVMQLSGLELIELSVCPVPANPATVVAGAKAMIAALKTSKASGGVMRWSEMNGRQKHDLYVRDRKTYDALRATRGWHEITPDERRALIAKDPAAAHRLIAESRRVG